MINGWLAICARNIQLSTYWILWSNEKQPLFLFKLVINTAHSWCSDAYHFGTCAIHSYVTHALSYLIMIYHHFNALASAYRTHHSTCSISSGVLVFMVGWYRRDHETIINEQIVGFFQDYPGMLLGMLFPGDVPGLSEDFLLLEGRPKEPVCVSDFRSYLNYFAKFLAKIDIASQSFHNQNIPRPSQTPPEEFRNSQTRTVHRDPQIHVFAVLILFGSSHLTIPWPVKTLRGTDAWQRSTTQIATWMIRRPPPHGSSCMTWGDGRRVSHGSHTPFFNGFP